MTEKAISCVAAEDNILAYMLLSDEAYRLCTAKLFLADFFDDDNRKIFEILASCCGKEPDQEARLTLCWYELQKSMKTNLASIKLGRIMTDMLHWARKAPALQYWIGKLLEASQRRAVILMAKTVTDAALGASSGFMDILKEQYDAIMSRAVSTETTKLLGDTVYKTLEELEAAKDKPALMTVGIDSIDGHMGGFAKGENVVVGGLTGTGKSALAIAIAVHVAQQGKSVAFFSLEMSEAQIHQRILAQLAGVNLKSIVTSTYSRDERRAMVQASNEMQKWKFAVYDKSNVRLRDLFAKAITHKSEYGLDLLVLDYLQLVKPDNPKDSSFEALTKISRDVKVIARELNTTLLSLAQLNRESVKTGDPRIEHLKGTGSIGEDADSVLLLSERIAEDGEKLESGQKPIRLRLDKARRGERALFSVVFDAPYQRFVRPPVVEWEF